jgi:hypothetical protein
VKRALQFADILSVVSTFDPLLTPKLSVQRTLVGEVTDRLASPVGLTESVFTFERISPAK